MNEEFVLNWEEMIAVYELIEPGPIGKVELVLLERLQEALKPRDVVEG
jgi:hypothetical protein